MLMVESIFSSLLPRLVLLVLPLVSVGWNCISLFWGIYVSRLGLGQGIFESSGWSGAFAHSVEAVVPWFIRGGQAPNLTEAGVESIYRFNGDANTAMGFRGK